MQATTVVNLKGHRDDPAYANVIYVGRAMYRGGWRLPGSPLSSPYRPGPDGAVRLAPGDDAAAVTAGHCGTSWGG